MEEHKRNLNELNDINQAMDKELEESNEAIELLKKENKQLHANI